MTEKGWKRYLPYVLATLAGIPLHFFYGWFPNPVTALFSPVRESLWEHGKLFLYPLLALMLWETRGGKKEKRGAWYLTILITFAAMLGVGYGYYLVLGGEGKLAGLTIYLGLMLAAFALIHFLDRPAVERGREALGWCVLALAGAIALFTFLPPDNILFVDLTGTYMWYRLPC